MKRYICAAVCTAALVLFVAVMVTGGIDSSHGIMIAMVAAPALSPESIEQLGAKLTAISADVKNFAEDISAKMKAGQDLTQELKGKADKALADQAELRQKIEALGGLPGQFEDLSARAKEIEQTIAKRATGGEKHASQKTPGEFFLDDPKVKAFLAEGFRSRGRVRVDMAAVTTVGIGAGVVEPQRVSGILALPERRMTIRDLLTPGRTNSNSIQYWQESGFTLNAAVVSEGVSKPEATMTGSLKTANVATIANILIAAKQIVEDAPALQSHIDGRLRYNLAYAEEQEILSGDGTGVHLLGLIPQATAYDRAFLPEFPTRIDAVRLALLQSELALFPASGIVTDPTSWARIETTKDNEGRYIFTMPQNETTPRLWGRPVVATPAIATGKFLVGAFKLGAQIFDREDANVELSTEDGDNFKKNLVTLRAEERLALACYRPEAFIYGTFQTTT